MFIRYLIVFNFLFAMVSNFSLYYKRQIEDSEEGDLLLPSIDQRELDSNTKNYETLGDNFEGDIKFPARFDPSKQPTGKGVALYGSRQWPRNIIPYDLSAITSTSDQNTIKQAINTLMFAVGTPIQGSKDRRPCVYFRPKTSSDKDYLRFVYGNGCSATPGYWENYAMRLTLAKDGCFHSGIIQHELMHALGFYHEQSRPDRDTYLTVNHANIESGREGAFARYVWGSTVLNQKTPYDYQSLMHYGAYYFSRNNQPTLQPKQSGVTIGQREKLSATDIVEVRAYYSC